MLRPAICSGTISDMLTASLAKHSRTLRENRYFNGHPDLTEDADTRQGWYGGLGPGQRQDLAEALQLLPTPAAPPDPRADALRLREEGKSVNKIAELLGCSRRTCSATSTARPELRQRAHHRALVQERR